MHIRRCRAMRELWSSSARSSLTERSKMILGLMRADMNNVVVSNDVLIMLIKLPTTFRTCTDRLTLNKLYNYKPGYCIMGKWVLIEKRPSNRLENDCFQWREKNPAKYTIVIRFCFTFEIRMNSGLHTNLVLWRKKKGKIVKFITHTRFCCTVFAW